MYSLILQLFNKFVVLFICFFSYDKWPGLHQRRQTVGDKKCMYLPPGAIHTWRGDYYIFILFFYTIFEKNEQGNDHDLKQ